MSVVFLVVLYMYILAPYHTLPQDYMSHAKARLDMIKASLKIIFAIIFKYT